MEKKDAKQYSTNNIRSMKVAIFCITAIIIFYLGANFLKGLNVFSHKTYYYAVFDNVGALHESTTVTLNGYPVGKVSEIKILSSNPVRICAEILLTEDVDLPKDSRFEVAQKDVLGGMVVNLILGRSSQIAHNKDTLACGLAPGMFDGLDEMKAQLQSVIASVDTIGLAVKSVFLPQDQNNGALMLKNTLVNLEQTTHHLNAILASNEYKVNDMVTKLNKLSTTLSDATPQLNAIITNLDHISDSLAQANIRTLVTEAQQTMAHINALTRDIENGNGTVGKLLQNDSLYHNINNTAESLDLLLKDLKQHPSKYVNITVFGGKKNKNK